MTKKLNEQLTQDLLLIDPYYSQKKQSRIFNVSINKMMKFRKDAGLECKAKGRPIVQTKYKGEEEYPIEVKEAVERIPILMEQIEQERIKKRDELKRIKLEKKKEKEQNGNKE